MVGGRELWYIWQTKKANPHAVVNVVVVESEKRWCVDGLFLNVGCER